MVPTHMDTKKAPSRTSVLPGKRILYSAGVRPACLLVDPKCFFAYTVPGAVISAKLTCSQVHLPPLKCFLKFSITPEFIFSTIFSSFFFYLRPPISPSLICPRRSCPGPRRLDPTIYSSAFPRSAPLSYSVSTLLPGISPHQKLDHGPLQPEETHHGLRRNELQKALHELVPVSLFQLISCYSLKSTPPQHSLNATNRN